MYHYVLKWNKQGVFLTRSFLLPYFISEFQIVLKIYLSLVIPALFEEKAGIM